MFRRSERNVTHLLTACADPKLGARSAVDIANFYELPDMLTLLRRWSHPVVDQSLDGAAGGRAADCAGNTYSSTTWNFQRPGSTLRPRIFRDRRCAISLPDVYVIAARVPEDRESMRRQHLPIARSKEDIR